MVIGLRGDGVDVNPAGGLPFVPVALHVPRIADTFAAFEAAEFGGHPERASAGYRTLVTDPTPRVRAGALLRLGRAQRKMQDFAGALVTYRQLAELGAVPTDDLPAELAGLNGQQSTYLAMGDHGQANDVARRILHGLDRGRWLIARGTAEFYREPFSDARPPSWALAHALSEVWRDTNGRLSARGQRVFGRAQTFDPSVLVVWRSNGVFSAALADPPMHFSICRRRLLRPGN